MEPAINLKFLKKYKSFILGGIALLLLVIMGILMITGKLDCERTSIRGGVFQTCDCAGFEVAVKSTPNSGERKTVCLGRITNLVKYQEE